VKKKPKVASVANPKPMDGHYEKVKEKEDFIYWVDGTADPNANSNATIL